MDLLSKIDFHVHSEYSREEQSKGFTIPKMCELADRKGIKYILYTEHWRRSEELKLFKKIRREIEACKGRYKAKVLLSAEINIINSKGETAVDLSMAKEVLDIISVSPHHYPGERERTENQPGMTRQLLPDILEDARDMVISAARKPEVQLILHPQITGQVVDIRPVPKEYYYQMMEEVKKNDKAVECTNISMLRAVVESLVMRRNDLPLDWKKKAEKNMGNSKDISWWRNKLMADYSNYIQAVVETGVKFVIGTDAHNERMPDFLGGLSWFGETQDAIALLKKYGVDESKLWIPHLEAEFKNKWR